MTLSSLWHTFGVAFLGCPKIWTLLLFIEQYMTHRMCPQNIDLDLYSLNSVCRADITRYVHRNWSFLKHLKILFISYLIFPYYPSIQCKVRKKNMPPPQFQILYRSRFSPRKYRTVPLIWRTGALLFSCA